MVATIRWLALLVVVGVAAWLWSENRRLILAREHAAEQAERTVSGLRSRVSRLEHELKIAIDARQHVVRTIEEKREEIASLRAERAAQLRRATKPPPEGVRLALRDLNDQLRADGYGGIRLLQAAKIEDRALREVELTEYREDSFGMSVFRADRVWFELDRTTGSLTVRLFDGKAYGFDLERAFPPDGSPIELGGVDGPAWERRFPFLLRTSGAYPVEPDRRAVERPSIDPGTASVWEERLDGLLELAETEVRYRIGRLRDLEEGQFRDVLVHGYDVRKSLVLSMKARSMAVVVDDLADTAELVLREGVVLRAGGRSEIGPGGYRVFLPGVTAKVARDRMLGMVSGR